MQIIGFNFKKISVEREKNSNEKLEINSNIHIEDISKEEIKFSKEETLRLEFTYTIEYNQGNLAKLEFRGVILFIEEKEDIKEFLKSWKDKKIPEKYKLPLFNVIMHKCNIRAIQLEDEMNLPLHIQLPKLTPKKE
jgi:hypothetical protein